MTHSKIGKTRIIFVDDEPDILSGLRRMLRGQRNKWEMKFAESGEEALGLLSKERFDVIISDMRMPGMDGAQLLAEVMNTYPNIVRIVLSGHSDREMIYKSVGAAHQYLAKPCGPELLIRTVERACALRSLLVSKSLQELVSRLHTLPSLPSLFMEINDVLQSKNGSLSMVGEIISKDAGMTAKILQLVNSAFFGFYSEVTSPSQAVTLLGLDTVRALITSVHVFSELKEKKIGDIAVEDFWNHFFIVGSFSREIMKLESADAKLIDMASMAGMLHDIGKIILFTNLKEKYEEAMAIAKKQGVCLNDVERRIFHSSHSQVGAYLLGLWGIPDDIIEAVFFHHDPGNSPEREFGLVTTLHVANALVAEQAPSYTMGKLSQIDYRHIETIGKLDRINVWKEKLLELLEKNRK
ncbi:hypothetical protein MNBD_NITROSPINAE02-426 [hydrothermal vent metagenome]|uniref:Response regulator n=1 Tax=hydrothermal vent metagenome TaxID=652676 RepID=A0A3B1CCF5_9ZZZZ